MSTGVAIVGIGTAGFGRFEEESVAALADSSRACHSGCCLPSRTPRG